MSSRTAPIAAAALAVFVLAACDGPTTAVQPVPETLTNTFGATLVECPSSQSRSASGMIGTRGGSVSLERHSLSVPRLGVQLPTEFAVTDLASNYLMLRMRANGEDGFDFQRDATVTIDYSRCNRSNIDRRPLSVWKIDSQTRELLYPVAAVDDKEARTVTFTTGTLSAYAIAN